ncbi:MerR family transcriptional regulator [Aduncisulcus paluster]|uniref:MerR family transcriptional regulator n=1 Tax=Aduncisulcus paluster TaxID=2918883 RepID=A0ABQ5L205_9EUKA|nr:MerR family transcriptional regulator [Aduncisulcus paluster]
MEPIRTESGQRLYNDGHIALISRIKTLLHDEGLTIEGARKRLDSPDDIAGDVVQDTASLASDAVAQMPLFSHEEFSEEQNKEVLREIRDELLEIKRILK